jgi:hypothetical protein
MATSAGGDIFGYKRSGKPRGVISSSEAVLTISGAEEPVGALIQDWQVQYQQEINEIFELGSDQVYWIKGRPKGEGSVGRIVAFKNVKFFSPAAYDVCQGGDTVSITAGAGACYVSEGLEAQTVALTLGGTIVTSIQFSSQVQDTLIQEKLGFKFSSLRLT